MHISWQSLEFNSKFLSEMFVQSEWRYVCHSKAWKSTLSSFLNKHLKNQVTIFIDQIQTLDENLSLHVKCFSCCSFLVLVAHPL